MPAALPDRPAGFAPFRRHRTGRALCAYVLAELEDGRLLPEILEDGFVHDCASDHPEVLEELAWDQEILAAIEEHGRPRRYRTLAIGERGSASPAVRC